MSGDASQPQRVHVGKRSQFTEGSRQLVKCGVRNIAVICCRSQLYAIDNACYHHGGPLLRGDIEELGGHPCIVCPWHSYKIALDTGEGLYMGIDVHSDGRAPQQTVKSKGPKQRVHHVTVDEMDDVYVTVDLSGPKWESDTYASMELANRERATAAPMEGDGRGPLPPGLHSTVAFGARSGHVFQQMGLLVSRGRGGTNPLNAEQEICSPLYPTLIAAQHSLRGSCKTNAHVTYMFVSCRSITDVCTGVREFDFVYHSGPFLRHAELGKYVELELPLKEGTDCLAAPSSSSSSTTAAVANAQAGTMRRRWTICDVNRNGSLFTLMVKATSSDPQRSGSAWLHQRSLCKPLRVCRVGGTFTFADHRGTIRQLGGNTLWVTAGIGITSAYAAMNASLDDSFFAEGSDQLHVVHLHANHTLETVPKLDEFVRWQQRFPVESGASIGAGRGSKTYLMELFISPKNGDEEGSALRRPNDAIATSLPTTPVTHRQHLHKDDVLRAVQMYFGSHLPLAYVCGPPNFVSDCTDALLSAGLPESHILTDDPY